MSDLDLNSGIVSQFVNLKPSYQTVPLLVVRVGDSDMPATAEDITDMQAALENAMEGGKPAVLVTHHSVDFETVYVPVVDGKLNAHTTLFDEDEDTVPVPELP
jgi:hypothetical protein